MKVERKSCLIIVWALLAASCLCLVVFPIVIGIIGTVMQASLPPAARDTSPATPFLDSPDSPVELVWKVPVGPEDYGGPWGLAIDGQDYLYVQDINYHRIIKYDTDGSKILQWGSKGRNDGQFDFDAHILDNSGSIAIDRAGNLHVADNSTRIQKFDSGGNLLWATGVYRIGGLYSSFRALAIDGSGYIYAMDQSIYRLSERGDFLGTFNEVSATGMAFDNKGNLFVTTSRGIVKLSSSGTPMLLIETCGSGESALMLPLGIALDSEGNVYATDTDTAKKDRARVCKFNNAGRFLTEWSLTLPGEKYGHYPHGIAVDSKANVYVSVYYQHHVLKFRQK